MLTTPLLKVLPKLSLVGQVVLSPQGERLTCLHHPRSRRFTLMPLRGMNAVKAGVFSLTPNATQPTSLLVSQQINQPKLIDVHQTLIRQL
jgi:hypothetical protein